MYCASVQYKLQFKNCHVWVQNVARTGVDCGTVTVERSGVDPEPNERETLPQRARIRESKPLSV